MLTEPPCLARRTNAGEDQAPGQCCWCAVARDCAPSDRQGRLAGHAPLAACHLRANSAQVALRGTWPVAQYKPGGRPFAAEQASREPRAATVSSTMCGVVHGTREGADELSRQDRASGSRHPADPPRRRRQGHGPGQFRRRHDNAGYAVGPNQAQPPCSRPDRIDQYRKGAGTARSQGGHHPRRFSRHHARARAYWRRAA